MSTTTARGDSAMARASRCSGASSITMKPRMPQRVGDGHALGRRIGDEDRVPTEGSVRRVKVGGVEVGHVGGSGGGDAGGSLRRPARGVAP